MSFFGKMFKGGGDDKEKKPKGSQRKPFNIGGQKKFRGSGQSLGGGVPGKLISVVMVEEGPIGVKIEQRPNQEMSAIVSMVVEGSQADAAGLRRGDILCVAGTQGTTEMSYQQFIAMARSSQRPIEFDIRRIETKAPVANSASSQSAEQFARKQAVIAAAEAREKASKQKQKPIPKTKEKAIALSASQRLQMEKEREERMKQEFDDEPKSEEARLAMAKAKQGEAALAAQLGYNPYETNKLSAGQARNATVAVSRGSIVGPEGESSTPIPAVASPQNVMQPIGEGSPISSEFLEAYEVAVTTNTRDAVIASFGIIRKLIVNATTKGQDTANMESAAKFRRVRLSNPKIKSAIVDTHGCIEIMLAVGFQLTDEGGESFLAFPFGNNGPNWLGQALKRIEQFDTI